MPDELADRTGHLKIILGYAAGVGKTYRMLEEGQQLAAAGHDVVIGYFEPHGRKDTIAKTEGLELIPRRVVQYRERAFEEMDTEAILARDPEIALVDEFPHTNVPGSDRSKRWEDVLVLLDAGIDVITTMNIQHLESLNDQMRKITGIQVRETIPDWITKRADEVVLADLTPNALLNRLDRGVVYAPEKAQRAKTNFFKESTLAALREMALRQTAHEIDVRNVDDSSLHPMGTAAAARSSQAQPVAAVQERILIHVTEAPTTAGLIRRGRRVADYLKADCFAVCVLREPLPAESRHAIERHLDFSRRLHIETRILEGTDEAEVLVDFAHTNGVTQIYVAKPPRSVVPFLFRRQLVMRIVRLATDIQVTVVADRRKRMN
ncbi:MAG: histidine kinase [Bryobacterales bacterium]|nr:histidine kinase [Bryobacterales bacterium]